MLGQGEVEGGGFLGGFEGFVQSSVLGQEQGEVVEAACEVGGVGVWVVLGQGEVEGGGFLGGFEGLSASP